MIPKHISNGPKRNDSGVNCPGATVLNITCPVRARAAENQFGHFSGKLNLEKGHSRGIGFARARVCVCKGNRDRKRVKENEQKDNVVVFYYYYYYFANIEGKSLLLGTLAGK